MKLFQQKVCKSTVMKTVSCQQIFWFRFHFKSRHKISKFAIIFYKVKTKTFVNVVLSAVFLLLSAHHFHIIHLRSSIVLSSFVFVEFKSFILILWWKFLNTLLLQIIEFWKFLSIRIQGNDYLILFTIFFNISKNF